MSNKYNTQLQSNNTDLQAILNTINELPEAGGSDPILQDKTVSPTTSQQTVTADSGYDGLDTVTVNAMPTATQATPTITVNASGLITATATQTAGYVAAGSKSATKQLAFQAAKTITPTTTNQTAVSSGYYTGGAITVKGDSNLVAGNIKSGVSIFGVSGTYEGNGSSSGGGDTSAEDGLITRTLTTYTNDRVTTIGAEAFANCKNLSYVSLPNITSVGAAAFLNCAKLISINCPSVTYIGISAFDQCVQLSSINFPKVTRLMSNAFSCCIRLAVADFPLVSTISTGVFYSCTSLTTANFPNASNIYTSAFLGCRNLFSTNFPIVQKVYSSAFYECSSLTTISFPKLSSIGRYAFRYCNNLTTIYITNSVVCLLEASNAFSGAGIWSNKGSIFVPSSLVASYKTATNWVFFSNRIFAAP